MTKLFSLIVILFSMNSFAGTKGADLWPDFKRDCEAQGGYATPVPNQCAQYATAAAVNSNITYTSIPDGSSPNSKCCIKCKAPLQSLGTNPVAAERKCTNANGAIWVPTTPPGCCFKPSPPTTTAIAVETATAVAQRRYCAPPLVYVTSVDVSPVPLTAAACTSAGYTWGLNACCKNP